MSSRLRISLTVLSPVFWLLIHISISLFLFYWRISNEPGITDPSGFLWSYRIISFLGLTGTLAVNAVFIKYREKKVWITWVLNAAVSIFYAPVMFLTLLMMV